MHLLVVPLVMLVKKYRKMSWCVYLGLYGLIQLAIYVISLSSVYLNSFPTGSALIVTCEMARMSMKTHAYIREKLVIGLHLYDDFAKYLPEWAKKRGMKETDIDLPEIDV